MRSTSVARRSAGSACRTMIGRSCWLGGGEGTRGGGRPPVTQNPFLAEQCQLHRFSSRGLPPAATKEKAVSTKQSRSKCFTHNVTKLNDSGYWTFPSRRIYSMEFLAPFAFAVARRNEEA